MASEQEKRNEELRRRRQAREKRRREAERERRKMLLRLSAVAVVAVVVTVMIVAFAWNAGNRVPETTAAGTTSQPTQTTAAPVMMSEPTGATSNDTAQVQTEPTQGQPAATTAPETTEPAEFSTIHIAAAGDLNITDAVVENGQTVTGYDFSQAFLDVAPILSQADLTILNFEGILAGTPYGSENSSAPPQMAQALADMGVDVVQTANSATIRGGILGLQATLDAFDRVGIQTLGTYRDSAEFRSSGGYTILEVDGFRIALVAFTKGMDNLGLPEGSEDCVNLLYTDYTTDYKKVDTDGINKILRKVAEEQPDITIAMLHWGSEYNESVSSTQKTIRDLMLSGGVDIILGTHPHLVQAIEFDQEAGTLVAYSLGDFYGDATQPGSNYSLILDIEIQRDNLTGEVKVAGYSYTPIFTLRPEQSGAGGLRVVRIQEAMARYASNYLGRVSADTYDSMAYALTRIEQRISQEMD